MFDEGEVDKVIDIKLSEEPQDSEEVQFDVTLMTPISKSGVALGDCPTTRVIVDNDLGKMKIEVKQLQGLCC